MKNILIITACFLSGAFSSRAQCPNGDLEAGTLMTPEWKSYINSSPSTGIVDPTAFSAASSSPRHTLTTGSPDPYVGAPLMDVGNGSYALKLGDDHVGAESEISSYTFTLTSDFSFMYALVFENPHTGTDNPFFAYWISFTDDLATSTLSGNLLATDEYRATASPFYTALPSGILYRPWTKECVLSKFPSLAAYVGHVVTIYFATADCSLGGHFGYAYIDELCKSTTGTVSFTSSPSIGHIAGYPLMVTAAASAPVIDYYYTATPCTSAGIPTGPSTSTSPPPAPPTPGPLPSGPIDIRSWFPPSYFVMTSYYKLTLHAKLVTTGCEVYSESSNILYVN